VSRQIGHVQYVNSGCWTELPATWLEVRGGEVRIHKYRPVPTARPAVETETAPWSGGGTGSPPGRELRAIPPTPLPDVPVHGQTAARRRNVRPAAAQPAET
jgi:hypothetical protein